MAGEADDLRATQDSITADSKRLTELEHRKQQLAADDPEQVELSAEAEALSQELQHKTSAQRELAEELNGEAG